MTIQEILEAHRLGWFKSDGHNRSINCQECGAKTTGQGKSLHSLVRQHQAEVLEKHMQEREAEAFAKGQASVKRGYNAFGESFDDPANPYETESTNGH